jgi:hypothetical protein
MNQPATSRLETLPPQILPANKANDALIGHKNKVFNHYLLLPVYSWGVADWDLDSVRPFILERQPTVGFSVDEACLSSKVTIFENKPGVLQPVIQQLIASGCQVDLLTTSGTVIASETIERVQS